MEYLQRFCLLIFILEYHKPIKDIEMKKHLHSLIAMLMGYILGFAGGINHIDPLKYHNLFLYIFLGFVCFNFSGIPEKLREWAGLTSTPEKTEEK